MSDTKKPSAALRVDYGTPGPDGVRRRRATDARQGPSELADVLGWLLGAGVVLLAAGIAAQEVKVGGERPPRAGAAAPAMTARRTRTPQGGPQAVLGTRAGDGAGALR